MNFDLMTSIENRGAEFTGVNYLAEIFDNPIMSVTEDGDEIKDWDDLFRRGEWGEIFIPNTEMVSYRYSDDGSAGEVSALEFVAWQILNANSHFIYYLINKIDGSNVAMDLYEGMNNEETQFWDGEELHEFWVHTAEEDWLNEYILESLNEGIKFIERCKQEKPEEFSFNLAESALDSHSGIVGWLESDLSMDLSLKSNYNNWDVKIMCVAEGKMTPYLEPGISNLLMDEYNVFSYFVRNYDEG